MQVLTSRQVYHISQLRIYSSSKKYSYLHQISTICYSKWLPFDCWVDAFNFYSYLDDSNSIYCLGHRYHLGQGSFFGAGLLLGRIYLPSILRNYAWRVCELFGYLFYSQSASSYTTKNECEGNNTKDNCSKNYSPLFGHFKQLSLNLIFWI